jgi:glycine/D-amino acid oxidase-like deaminating enzyme
VRLVRDILKSESIDAETTPDGYLEVAHQANRVRQLETESTFMAEMFGLSSRVVGREELRRDYLVSREAHGAILYDEAFALHPLKYALGLAKAAEARGVFLHDRSPVQDWSTHGKMHVLKTPGGRVRAREVVIATNGYTGDRLHPDMAGRLLPALSSIIVTRPLTQAERASANWRTHLPISDTRNLLFYYRLLPDGRVLFGARGAIEDTAKTRNHRREWLHRRLTDMFDPLADVSIESFWSGWVSVPFDRTPHVGRLDGQNVHYALGYVGTGVAMATYCGMLLANQIADRPGPRPSPLLSQPIPRYPLPSLRRLYQRAIYALFELQDRL